MNETYIQTIRGGIQHVIHLTTESHHTVAKVFIDVDGTEYRTI